MFSSYASSDLGNMLLDAGIFNQPVREKNFDALLLLTTVLAYCSYRFFEVKGPIKEMYVIL